MQTNNPSNSELYKYNFKRNKEKATYALKGILSGIVADNKINDLELIFLDLWLSYQDNLTNDGDAFDLQDMLSDILNDGVITQDELKELHLLIDDIIEYRHKNDSSLESKINEFLALITGVISDDIITEEEIFSISSWIENNIDVEYEWPIYSINETIKIILKDGVITDEEKNHLLNCIKDITGIKIYENGIVYGMATDYFRNKKVDVFHSGANYCFTGKFLAGDRKLVKSYALKNGANIKDRVVKDLDFLVVGTLASRDWIYTSHGRKIEKAMKFQKKGKPIQIITEDCWLKHLEK